MDLPALLVGFTSYFVWDWTLVRRWWWERNAALAHGNDVAKMRSLFAEGLLLLVPFRGQILMNSCLGAGWVPQISRESWGRGDWTRKEMYCFFEWSQCGGCWPRPGDELILFTFTFSSLLQIREVNLDYEALIDFKLSISLISHRSVFWKYFFWAWRTGNHSVDYSSYHKRSYHNIKDDIFLKSIDANWLVSVWSYAYCHLGNKCERIK